MRTTLTIDDDVLAAAKAMADREGLSIGKVISELARRALLPPTSATERNGIPLLPDRPAASVVTLDTVNALRDELP